MIAKVHDALTEALECIKESGLIRKYALVWSGRGAQPHCCLEAADTSDEALRDHLVHSLAGLATIEKD